MCATSLATAIMDAILVCGWYLEQIQFRQMR
jgi:hypothetical protein